MKDEAVDTVVDAVVGDIRRLLRVTPDMFGVVAEGHGEQELLDRVSAGVGRDEQTYQAFLELCRFITPYHQSWLHQPGEKSPYLSLEVARTALDERRHRALLGEIVLSASPSIPYDYRALAAAELARAGADTLAGRLLRAVREAEPPRMRSVATKLESLTDGIDHIFEIPSTVEGRLELLRQATAVKTTENRARLACRILRANGLATEAVEAVEAFEQAVRIDGPALTSAEAERLIAEDAANELVEPADHLIPWDQELATPRPGGPALTLAELLRITLLAGEFKLPDATVRPVLIDFYRAALRISGRVVIGLGAGLFYVEHGADAHPSYFYLGRDAVVGKGCSIDVVGGAVLQQGSFVGGGFVPLLIHTHKHLRRSGEPGVAERKKVLPAIFVAETGARLPMETVGIFETADHLGAEQSPYPGIRALSVEK